LSSQTNCADPGAGVTGFTRSAPSVRAEPVPAESNAYIAMAKLTILRYPDPRLHTVAKPVAQVDARIRQLVDDMLETMYDAEGVGLAATQVDVHERVIVIDTSDTRDQPRVLINPEIVAASPELALGEEGCLSVPQIYDKVQRHARVTVRALDRDGATQAFEAEGLLAVCVQHEMDHLMGKVFVEYLSPFKRDRIKSRLLKKTREEQRV
jgi:peptide deformylase